MAKPTSTARPMFTVSNHHAPSCGDAPVIDGDDPRLYVGYFVNQYGEQAVFTYDRESRRATLQMGDAEWSKEYRVVDAEPQGLILDEAESLWIRACWLAMRGVRT